jgi:hypothetical protein
MPKVALAHDQGTASAGGAGIRQTACAGAHVKSSRWGSDHRRRVLACSAVCTEIETVRDYTREIFASIAINTYGRANSIFVLARLARPARASICSAVPSIADTAIECLAVCERM